FNRALTGAEVWRFDGPGAANWTQVNQNGWSEAGTEWCYGVQVFSNMLYVGASNENTGAQIWRYDGTNWKKVANAGFGDAGNSTVRSLTSDGSSLYAGTTNMTGGAQVFKAGSPGNIWYLAEGTSAWGFSTYMTLENPGSSEAHARITYMTSSGPVDGGTVTLPARSQTTVNPKDTVGEVDFSTKVQCLENSQIAVDRTMYWDFGAGTEAHSSVAVKNPAYAWFLPEGSSAWGFECWLLIQNPNSSEATCRVTYMVEGEGPQVFEKKVAANSRASYNMAEDIGAKDASIRVEADMPVIPERAMYRNSRREGHDSIGTTAATADFYLAEGTSAWGFTTYVLVQNPNPAPCDVTLTYMTNNGPVPQAPFSMPANSRKTVRVNDVLPNTDFSTHVEGTLPVIAERAMYWDNGTGEACHDSIGMSEAHKNFYLPDGQTSEGRETWTLVQNPNNTAVQVEITYMTPDGSGNQTFPAGIPANSRMTFSMADAGINGRAATYVTCKTAGKKIMVERAMYWNSRGAGTDTIGGYSD
ncbi:MAG: hypothetical protein JW738_01770, partial [Actinobacteria bacterium]|nr:hypothetical protein [Actinomycetota bacterium]